MNAASGLFGGRGIQGSQAMRVIRTLFAVVIPLLVLLSSGAAAQTDLPPQCMASFNVMQDRSITYFGWLPGGAGSGINLNCSAAEVLRQQLFMGQGVTPEELAAAISVPDPLRVQRDLLARRVAELQSVTTLDQLKTLGQLLMVEAAKYQAAYVCLTAETPPGLFACAGVMVAIAKQAYTLWRVTGEGGIGTARAGAVAELNQQIALLDRAIAAGRPRRLSIEEARALLLQAQTGLCTEVRRSCLSP